LQKTLIGHFVQRGFRGKQIKAPKSIMPRLNSLELPLGIRSVAIRDPHGEPIPSADLIMPKNQGMALAKLKPNQEGCIQRVYAQDADFLKHLEQLGLVIGARESHGSVALRSGNAHPRSR
jgi:hypothetical protein